MNKTIVFNGPGSNSLYIPSPTVTKEVHPKKEVVVFDDPGSSYKSDEECCTKKCNSAVTEFDGQTLITILEKLQEALIVTEEMLSDLIKLKLQNLYDTIILESLRALDKESEILQILNDYALFLLISEQTYEETKLDLDSNILYIINRISDL